MQIHADDPWQHWLQSKSEEAFRAVVARHLPLVLATAQRRTQGDAALAQDIAQLVFIDLARHAPSLSKGTVLSGWLYRHTCFTAAKAMRTERRRSHRERRAAELMASGPGETEASNLDEILEALPVKDRHALLLRFADGMDLENVAKALGTSRSAAQKRIERAVARLKESLPKALRPRTASAAGIAALLVPASSETAAAAMVPAVQQLAVVAGSTGKAAPLLTFFKNLGTLQAAALGVAAAIVVWAVPLALQVRDMRAREAAAVPRSAATGRIPAAAGKSWLTAAEAGEQMAAIFLERGFSDNSATEVLALLKQVPAADRLDAVTAMLGELPPGSNHSASVKAVLEGFARDAAWFPRNYPDDILKAMALMPRDARPDFSAIIANHPDADATVRLYRELVHWNKTHPRDSRPTFASETARALAGRSIRESLDFCRAAADATSSALEGLALAAAASGQHSEVFAALAGETDHTFQRTALAALIKATPVAACGPLIDRQAPGTFRSDAATLLARKLTMYEEKGVPELPVEEIAAAWLSRVPPEDRRERLATLWQDPEGSTERWEDLFVQLAPAFTGPDLDALLVLEVKTLGGNSTEPNTAIEACLRIADPDVRFYASCELIDEWVSAFGPNESSKTKAKQWMEQHFTPEQREVFALLYRKL